MLCSLLLDIAVVMVLATRGILMAAIPLKLSLAILVGCAVTIFGWAALMAALPNHSCGRKNVLINSNVDASL